eukprot:GSChrysophyteH1.ASY1.ANO1.2044.1 assembled CDS
MPLSKTEEQLLFVVEHYDPLPRLKRQYLLKVFIDEPLSILDIEMIDVKSSKKFLKRTAAPKHIVREDFFIGATVLLMARELVVIDYGDGATRQRLHHQMQQTVLLIPSEHANMQSQWGKIIDSCQSEGLLLVRAKSGENGVSTGIKVAKKYDNPSANGEVNSENCSLLVATTGVQSLDLKNYLLEGDRHLSSSVTLDNNTCCIIKPHAVKSKLTGAIMDHILQQSYEISAVSSLYFDRTAAEEFLEVYNGVVPEYQGHVVELCSGMCVALELRAQEAVPTFRTTAGPWDVEMAKELRPDSLRGRYGVDRVRNAVHCTDLESDAVAECEYCFKILEGYKASP